eukprot:3208235-Pyramimonas_sp.AAC.1
MCKGYLDVAQRTRMLEGALLTTHLLPTERALNPVALASASVYAEKVEGKGGERGMGPPSLIVGTAVLEAICGSPQLQQGPSVKEELGVLQ